MFPTAFPFKFAYISAEDKKEETDDRDATSEDKKEETDDRDATSD